MHKIQFLNTVIIRIVAAATINFAPSSVRLIEGGYYLFRARAMIDTAARMRYVYIRKYAGQRPPDEFIARVATIRCAAIIRINTKRGCGAGLGGSGRGV